MTRSCRLELIFATALAALCVLAVPTEAEAQPLGLDSGNDTLTTAVLIHPPVAAPGERSVLFSREHTYDTGYAIGDQLARDFIVMKIGDDGIMRPFEPGTEGRQNRDWFTWRQDVLAPFDGVVTQVHRADTVNEPGTLNPEVRPGRIYFENKNGVVVSHSHLREISVEEGQQVKAGEVVAKAGNNGMSIAPHVHVAAWRGEMPLQIQVDLYAEERLRSGAKRE